MKAGTVARLNLSVESGLRYLLYGTANECAAAVLTAFFLDYIQTLQFAHYIVL
jgi:hypothetical protein